MTYGYAILVISPASFNEIRTKLLEAGYDDQMDDSSGALVIDMHGIALQQEEPCTASP